MDIFLEKENVSKNELTQKSPRKFWLNEQPIVTLIKKHADTLIEQAKKKPQKTLEFKLNKQMETFYFSQPINLLEEGKWLLAVTALEAANSVFKISYENTKFSKKTTGYWNSNDGNEFINKLNKVLGLRSENDLELYVKEVKKRVHE